VQILPVAPKISVSGVVSKYDDEVRFIHPNSICKNVRLFTIADVRKVELLGIDGLLKEGPLKWANCLKITTGS
jgi:hypothetical protein